MANIEEKDEIVHTRVLRGGRRITVTVYYNSMIDAYWLELKDDLDSTRWTLPGIHLNKADAIARAERVVLW